MRKKININHIDAIIFDFDGVLTDNRVYLNENGIEFVSCNRADGIGLNVLKKLVKHIFILSSEKNKVTKQRAKKLKINAITGCDNKSKELLRLSIKNKFNLKNTIYVGNDLNDFNAMKQCGYRVCPADSHLRIKKISNILLKTNGGCGIVRELAENILNIDILKYLK